MPSLVAQLPMLPQLPVETAGWHWLDVTLGICLAVVALNAARRGFVREAGTLLGLGIGVVLAGQHALELSDWLAERIGHLPLLDDAAWLAIVLLGASLAALLASAIRNWLPLPGIGVADRVFGLAFGVLEGAAGLGLVLLFVARVGVLGLHAPAFDGSTLAPVLLRWWLVVAASLPPELGNRLFFHGILNDQQLCRFYNKVDVVIAAEHHAGWCNVAAEAMACGRPVICTAAGTLDFAVNGVNALVVPSVTATHLGHALRVLMTSFDLRSKLSENGPAAVAAMDWHRWAGDFLSFCLADEAGNTRRNRSNTLPNVQELR